MRCHSASSQRTTPISSQALALCRGLCASRRFENIEHGAMPGYTSTCMFRANMHLSHRHLSCPAGSGVLWRSTRNHLLVLLIHLRKVPCSTWRTALYYLAQHVHVSLRALLRGKYRDADGCKQLSVRVCGACRPPDGVVRGRPAAHAHAPPRARFPHTPSRR
jgi:hypothetical protein